MPVKPEEERIEVDGVAGSMLMALDPDGNKKFQTSYERRRAGTGHQGAREKRPAGRLQTRDVQLEAGCQDCHGFSPLLDEEPS